MPLRLERNRREDPDADDGVSPLRQAIRHAFASPQSGTDPGARPLEEGGTPRGRLFRFAIGCAAVVYLLDACRSWLVPLVMTLILAFVLAPAVRRLARAGIPAPVGAALVMLAIAGVLIVAGAFAAEPAQALWARLPSAQARLLQLERELFRGGALGGADWQRGLSDLAGSAALPAAATVFLLYFLLVSEQALVIRCMQLCATPRNRARVLGALRDMQRDIRTFLCTMVATSVLLGIATGFALAAIGFPDAAFWGLFTAVITIIPYLGPALVTVALVLAGSAAYGAGWLLVVPAGLFLVLHFLESNLLTPFLMGAGVHIRPVFIVLAVLALSGSWGLAGGFVAVPILLAVRATGLRSRWSRVTRLVLQDRSALPEPGSLLRRGPR